MRRAAVSGDRPAETARIRWTEREFYFATILAFVVIAASTAIVFWFLVGAPVIVIVAAAILAACALSASALCLGVGWWLHTLPDRAVDMPEMP